MPYLYILRPRGWVGVACVLLGACVGVPGRGVPGRYAQSFDSATSSCRQNPALCARMVGEEAVVPRSAQRLAEAGISVATVGMALNADVKAQIEQELVRCAEDARTQVLQDKLQGRSPSAEECNELVPGRAVTLAMVLGEAMHEAAFRCAEAALNRLCPGRFSLEPRYRRDPKAGKTSFISEEEAQSLLRQGRGHELKGTVRPDVVIHSGDPLQARLVYDFKFGCTGLRPPEWTRYPKGHPFAVDSQKELYESILSADAWRIVPRWGVMP